MNRGEACGVLDELVACWRDRDNSETELVVLGIQAIGFEFGLRFSLNYPEYAVALRDALNNSSTEGDGSKERFLRAASDIIAAHPIEVRA
ncbi:hypothetical protein LCGC14_2863340 [marine sediment metagenome]|uniref:Uncharacterized protein n=1 Tax=marine sediment metagenome TaxID=412755 RepID=A0A0F9ADD2_9ZZZZ